jgi:translation initiation factor 2 beta subunit (eIF-2beta)/eIF-5
MKVKQEMHDAPMAGHHNEKTTREMLGKTFYWLEMKEDIEHYIHTYTKCQNTKLVRKKKFGLHRPFPIPS